MKKLKLYIQKVWKLRYFWYYLARSDVIARFRRSKMGLLWLLLNPLLMTCIMSLVFGTVFNVPMRDYAPYILSGIITWEMLTASVVAGGSSFLLSAQYIRQFNHPISIYSLKTALVYSFNFLIASIALALWTLLISPENLLVGLISLPLTIILLFLVIWPLITIAAFLNTKFRDYPQMVALIMQMLYFVSPVFLEERLFKTNEYLFAWFQVNPVTHILNLLRQPFLHGSIAPMESYLIVILCILLISSIAVYLNKNFEKSIIFYL